MPKFQRLVIWLHSDKKNNNNNGKEKNKQSVQEYKTKREEKESVQYQNNLFNSMLHLVVSNQQLIQQSLHQY